ncbi:TIM barrel protein [Chloroflexota bacterium]
MENLLFGTAGIPHSASAKSTVSGIERIADLGLGCMEVEFVHGVKMSETGTRPVKETAAATGVKLSAHAPYYINFNAHDLEKIRASQERLLQTARIAWMCGAGNAVFHPAFYLGDSPEKTYDTVKKYLGEVLAELREEKNEIWVRPEVMGKPSQFGTVSELLKLSSELEGLVPCIDFSHWHARNQGCNSYTEFIAVLNQIEESLGRVALDNMHIHVSGIAYGEKGERKHLNFKDSDFNYTDLLKAFRDYEIKGTIICESPDLEEGALLLQETYAKLA